MKVLQSAISNQRWDLAAHVIVFATAKALNAGKSHARKKAAQKKATVS
jgi:hypothetical protein